MEFQKVVEERRSIRHFNKKELTKETIEKILQAGVLAPSARNRQPWEFIVIKDDQNQKEDIANYLLESTDASTTLTCEAIKDCQALILVFANIENDLMDIQSVGACIENMVLKGTDLGVGSLWIGFIVHIEKYLQEMFHTDKKLIAAVALGYTDSNPSARPRKSIEEVTSWY